MTPHAIELSDSDEEGHQAEHVAGSPPQGPPPAIACPASTPLAQHSWELLAAVEQPAAGTAGTHPPAASQAVYVQEA